MKEFLRSRGIELFGAIPLSSCKITRGYLLERTGLDMDSTVVMMLLPYRSEHTPKNLSVYASAPDYHAFVSELREDIKAYLGERFEGEKFELFGDHSPIDEVNGACLAGLGFIGDNGLLINEEYSSFVFLCELITSIRPEALGLEMVRDVSIKRCIGCGACMRACPSFSTNRCKRSFSASIRMVSITSFTKANISNKRASFNEIPRCCI